ncbi:ADP-ribosylglycohydrolase family protein [Marinagarivorans algicola]|uniref:ADP-ribosylglycohydrolase family protein n=1 Tax=Marinagarivorans algicola TaxID=1513270 RepID=UPI003734EEEC
MDDKVKGALVGLACGDAVGTTLEFQVRGSFEPLTDMVGGGPFKLQAGQWTDDTSMALCLAHSLLSHKGFNPSDQMERYCHWFQWGYMSSNGRCFDIGLTVSNALLKYLDTQQPFSGSTDERSSGNGAIMRLAPIPIFYHNHYDRCLHYAGESARTTHGSPECIDSAKLLASLIFHAFTAKSKADIFEKSTYQPSCENVQAIANADFMSLNYSQITGSGYVIESLKSALWCFMNGATFEESILLAANIGNDADTTAAICGQISGAYYGLSGIPQHWRDKLVMAQDIEALALNCMKCSARQALPCSANPHPAL